MDLMQAAAVLYARWCQAHKGRDASGQPLPCWEALDGTQRATWTAIAESAYHHTRKCLEEHQALSAPVSGAAIVVHGPQDQPAPGSAPEVDLGPPYFPPRADGVGEVKVRVAEQAAPADKPRDLPENPGPLSERERVLLLLRLRGRLRHRELLTVGVQNAIQELLGGGYLDAWEAREITDYKAAERTP